MTTTIEIKGKVKDGFQRVKEAFAANFADHGEVGASLAVMVDGEMVVDLWGGYADGQRTRPWERDTIVNTFSTTKGMTAICANQLIEQGKLDPEAPVAKYWPEFAQAGKDKLPVKYLLSHKAGLPAVDNMIPARLQVGNAGQRAGRAEAVVGAGTQHGYHAVTFGSLVGEVIRRVSGMSVGTYFRKQVAEPLGIDYHIGFGPELDSRCAEMIPAPFQAPPPEHPLFAAFTNPQSMTFKAFMITPEPMLNPNYMNTREWRAAEVPAANGHGNARALATVYGALARGGEVNGVQRAAERHDRRHAQGAVERRGRSAVDPDAVRARVLPGAAGVRADAKHDAIRAPRNGRLVRARGPGGEGGHRLRDEQDVLAAGHGLARSALGDDPVGSLYESLYGLRARNRNEWYSFVSTVASVKPAFCSRAANPMGSTATHVSMMWKRRQRSVGVLSQPAKIAPGRRTRNVSATSLSWSAGDGTWCSIVMQIAPEKAASGNCMLVASPSTTVRFGPARRFLSDSASA